MPILFCTTNSLTSGWMAGELSLLFMIAEKTVQNPAGGSGLQPKNQLPVCQFMTQTAIIVPCRLESTRFPRKLLHKIKGRPLLLWVAERIKREAPEFPLWFAVDHELLRTCVTAAGFKALMTSAGHQTGTDRLAEATRTVRANRIINVQADEPLVSGRQLR